METSEATRQRLERIKRIVDGYFRESRRRDSAKERSRRKLPERTEY